MRAPLVSQGACRRLPVVTFLSNSAQKAPHPRPPASTDRWNRRRPTVAPSQGGCPGGHRGKGQTTEARTSPGTCVVRAPAGGGLLRMPGDVPGRVTPTRDKGVRAAQGCVGLWPSRQEAPPSPVACHHGAVQEDTCAGALRIKPAKNSKDAASSVMKLPSRREPIATPAGSRRVWPAGSTVSAEEEGPQ